MCGNNHVIKEIMFTLPILSQEDQIMEATEGLSEANSLQSQSVTAFAQLANSDKVHKFLPYY